MKKGDMKVIATKKPVKSKIINIRVTPEFKENYLKLASKNKASDFLRIKLTEMFKESFAKERI
jgi:hypothetical protein